MRKQGEWERWRRKTNLMWCDDDAMKRPEWNKAVAGVCASCNFIFASLPSLSLSLSHSLLSLHHYDQVNEGWRWMHGFDRMKKKAKTYERTNVIALQFFFKYTIIETNVTEMSKLCMWIYAYNMYCDWLSNKKEINSMGQQNRADLYLYNWLRRTRSVDDDNLFDMMRKTNNMEKMIMEISLC
jgi:hypothetical protein